MATIRGKIEDRYMLVPFTLKVLVFGCSKQQKDLFQIAIATDRRGRKRFIQLVLEPLLGKRKKRRHYDPMLLERALRVNAVYRSDAESRVNRSKQAKLRTEQVFKISKIKKIRLG